MKPIAPLFTYVFLLLSLGLVGCTESMDDALVRAAKKVRIQGLQVDEIMQGQVAELKSRGELVDYQWKAEMKSENEYLLTASISDPQKATSKPNALYTWILTKNLQKSHPKSSVWRLEAENFAAKKLMTLPRKQLQAMVGFIKLPTP